MKFYYNDKLIRTSKTHHYTHALLNSKGKAITCSATKEGCESYVKRYLNECNERIENAKKAIVAIKNGKKGYFAKYGRHTEYHKFDGSGYSTIEEFTESLEDSQNAIEFIKTKWKIVELIEIA